MRASLPALNVAIAGALRSGSLREVIGAVVAILGIQHHVKGSINNNRKMTDAERFDLAVKGILGKRLTFDQLAGKIPPAPRDNSESAAA